MKTKAISLLCLPSILALLGLSSCGQSENLYLAAPENSDLSFWLGEELLSGKMAEHTLLPGWFGAEEYLDGRYEAANEDDVALVPDKAITYLYSGYPDASDSYKVTRIKITDPEISVYGLDLSSEEEEIESTLLPLGFVNEGKGNYSQGRFLFSFDAKTITLSAYSTNKENIVY